MKAVLISALCLAAMLTSCSSEQNVDQPNNQVAIQLSVANEGVTVDTRGTGTVGDLDGDAENTWNGEELLISMFKRNDANFDLATNNINGVETVIMDHMTVNAPTNTVASGVVTMATKYFPANGAYTFFGLRLDDALYGTEATAYTISADNSSRYVAFKIDGTQDIMVAKTKVPTELNGLTESNLYSAKAARAGVHPELVFEHMLTRLEFTVVPGNEDAAGSSPVSVKAIRVESKTTGRLLYAYNTPTGTFGIEWDAAAGEEFLSLKERTAPNVDMTDLTPVSLQWDNVNNAAVESPVGESLMVGPADSYNMEIEIEQVLQGQATPQTTTIQINNVQLYGGAPFEAGTSYKIAFKVWGSQEIEVTATLTGWKDGGNINVNTED